MTRRQGFTLIETLFALIITAGMFLLVTGTSRTLTHGVQQDSLAWLQAVQVLERPGKYQLVRATGDVLVVKDHDRQGKQREMKVLVDKKGVLKIAAVSGRECFKNSGGIGESGNAGLLSITQASDRDSLAEFRAWRRQT